MRFILPAGCLLLAAMPLTALSKEKPRVICQMITDEQGRNLVLDGKCDLRQSPASTFKIAISLMGFDAGVLKDAHSPKLPVQKHYHIYRPQWREATDPAHWMRYSVVWYSQEIIARIGAQKTAAYLKTLNYGNQDMRGHIGADPMKGFWIGSSLKISPAEQALLMRKLMLGDLPVSEASIARTKDIMDLGVQENGWRLYGKTGSATPRSREGKKLSAQTFGWFVGFAEKGERKVAIAKLIQSPSRQEKSLGLLAKEQVMEDYFSQQSPL